jgi:uncharacterized protein with beta-barrel porin domain
LTIVGNLAFQSGAIYLVQISPSVASFANVTGTATLGGATVNAIFASGTYVNRQYTILTATTGVSGTFSSGVLNTNLPSGFKTSLSYDATHAYLNVELNFTPPPGPSGPNFGNGLSGNQQAVGNALINYFNRNGSIPLIFGALTPAALSQLSGESASVSQQATFQAMGQFLGVMMDPSIGGHSNSPGFGWSPSAYADQSLTQAAADRGSSDGERAARAAVAQAPAARIGFEQRWNIWAAGYGGAQTTSGNSLMGSNDAQSSVYGTAVGAGYHMAPDTFVGFAAAGGGTRFSVNGLGGGGRSDLFQVGGLIRQAIGSAYVAGALAYGWQDITTDRNVTVLGSDHLRAEFKANAYSGRVEGGYRMGASGLGVIPYAAGQFTSFALPAYMEQSVSGASTFALAYNARNVTDSRSELGIRTDATFAVQNGNLTMRGRAAWAYGFNPDRSTAASFQGLPGATFVVNGAAQAHHSALTTASAEMKWSNGWSAAATFEGEFSQVTSSYAGKGVVRCVW